MDTDPAGGSCKKEPIAIVGSACRFPGGCDTPSKLWKLLQSPQDIVRDFPPDRLKLSAFYNRNGEHHGSTNVKGKSYLLSEDVRSFDASFFNVNPLEAETMDPQHRMLLETVYEAFESAGCPLQTIQGSQTSVFVGLMTADWYDIQARDHETAPIYTATGTARSNASNRISYFFDLHGLSMTIDTACSSSLVALHQAVQSLRDGESSAAIVAGANLILDPGLFIGTLGLLLVCESSSGLTDECDTAESSLHMLSPNSHSRMWDKSADGYARGDGIAALLLKPLGRALNDGDHIEAIIRETGVNSDGRTKGITMPSSNAQASLIQQTYRNAGLDPVLDRCQYFECHGTGTLAGDPVEARAVKQALFSSDDAASRQPKQVLYAGSIKTIIGHTEGCAGLAGVLKVSSSMRHGIIPPNLHFEELNPDIQPFYDGLCVPTQAVPWPQPVRGPRRASVNSFGFGGTNAHAIIESFEVQREQDSVIDRETGPVTASGAAERFVGPLVLSAQSGTSLKAMIRKFTSLIRLHPSLPLRDLSWILGQRRSTLPVKAFFSGSTRQKLLGYMEQAVDEFDNGFGDEILHRHHLLYPTEVSGILGVFTGQGAQWATMGTNLLHHSHVFRDSVRRQQISLASLPDGPSWSLEEELLAPPHVSRVGEAAFSQPLSTAIQVALVDLMFSAGIHLDAVVGHSSGEIAAVYAAGIISAEDAIRISYYRGLHSNLACGRDDQPGGMMAVAVPLDSAQIFCDQAQFRGRICVAASNSGASVTLSGDLDAILEAKAIFNEDKIFCRQLMVDKAYHSHHMLRCADAYLESLRKCRINITRPRAGTVWVSSVRGDPDLVDEDRLQCLADQYWVDNMVQPVLFSWAVERSCWSGGPFELCLEIGPHPALKSPATQVFKSVLGHAIPYASLMRRGDDEVEAFAGGIGYLWQHLGPDFVDLEGLRHAFEIAGELPPPHMIKGLPTYPWEHVRPYWKESRISRQYRLGGSLAHELLGRRTPGSFDNEVCWRNFLRLNELPWLRGHEFQGQTLFPAGGYVSMAVEAAKIIAGTREIRTVEVCDLELPKACLLPEGPEGVEMIFVLHQDPVTSKSALSASFDCFTCHDEAEGVVERTCSGKLEIRFGEPMDDELPSHVRRYSNLAPIDMDLFYKSLNGLGLNYQGLFQGLRAGGRMDNMSQVSGCWLDADLGEEYILHPAFLDVGFQAVFCAYASPETGELWAPYLPVSIRRVTVNPNVQFNGSPGEITFEAHAYITNSTPQTLTSEIHMSNASNGQCGVIVDGFVTRAMDLPDAANDRNLFLETIWDQDLSSGLTIDREKETTQELAAIEAAERLTLHYRQILSAEIKPDEYDGLPEHHKLFLNSSNQLLERVRNGGHPYYRSDWLLDSPEYIDTLRNAFGEYLDVQLATVVAHCLPGVLRGQTHLLEVLLENDLLEQCYTRGLGVQRLNVYAADIMKQIAHRHPHSKILEIGAGTGGTTKSILEGIGDKFSSYTYTDISPSFFAKAGERFRDSSKKMIFKTLDIDMDIVAQEYQENAYDVVVASSVLHATTNLQQTLMHIRKLLHPGGYLILVEGTGDLQRLGFCFGGLPGWWSGAGEGRILGPCVPAAKWDELLQATGFSGISHLLHDTSDPTQHLHSLIISQAIDKVFDMIRKPLAVNRTLQGPVTLIGGNSAKTLKLIRNIMKILSQFSQQINVVNSIDVFKDQDILPSTSLIVLEELERILLMPPVNSERMSVLQKIFTSTKTVLWISNGRLNDNPLSNMMIGAVRTLREEIPDLNFQSLDFSQLSDVNAIACAEAFLRLEFATSPDFMHGNVLWTVEPEIVVDKDAVLIPRVVPNTEANERHNASRRDIRKRVQADRTCLEFVDADGTLVLREKNPVPNVVHIIVAYSIALPCIGAAKYYLCVGELSGKGCMAIAITQHAASHINVIPGDYFTLPESQLYDSSLLQLVAKHLTVLCIAARFDQTKGSVVIFDPPADIAEIFQSNEVLSEHKFCFASHRRQSLPANWIFLHPRATNHTLQRALPENLAFVVSMTASAEDSVFRSNTLLGRPVLKFEDIVESIGSTQSFLAAAVTIAIQKPRPEHGHAIRVGELVGAPASSLTDMKVVEWPHSGSLTTVARPLDVKTLFKAGRTYLLVGLTGELGFSLCRFMVQNGARYIVLASRNPDVSASWLHEMNEEGADVRMCRMDVSSRASVLNVVNGLRDSAPPIAGVCNGAMVLSDSMFKSMSAEDMNIVLRPKVNGSMILDRLFTRPTLDFFVLFSSFSAVLGIPGQSNYNAANLFMTGLAAQRKHRGLAGSVIDIGVVVDVGYVARQGIHVKRRLAKHAYQPLSEKDVQRMFAEAIIAGKPETPGSGQISTGIEPFLISPDTINRPRWTFNPRLSHMVREAPLTASKGASAPGKDNLRRQLEEAGSDTEAADLVIAAFSARLESMLLLSSGTVRPGIPLLEAGVDSLLAVEVRSWFAKEINVDIPVLKILSGKTIAEICTEAASRFLASCIERGAPVALKAPVDGETVSNKSAAQRRSLSKAMGTSPATSNAASTPVESNSTGSSDFGNLSSHNSNSTFGASEGESVIAAQNGSARSLTPPTEPDLDIKSAPESCP
ncbi:MAG: Type I Iterative PKS [Bathelium mastoideum]|nr:MAG: Type I Iterative PKS [Bathelium mastoideum]